MIIGPKTWAELEAGPGIAGSTRLRLHPKSGQDLFLSVVKPALTRRLLLHLPAATAAVKEAAHDSRGIRVAVEAGDAGGDALVVELTEPLFAAVFDPLVADIAAAASRAKSADDAAAQLLLRLEFWRSLLRDLDTGSMPTTRRRGLVGELHCLREVLLSRAGLPSLAAVQTWTGPLATNQDFQFTGGAIEVKATAAKKPQSLVITNERELDDTGVGNLVLVAVSLDERHGGAGTSLNTMVSETRNALVDPAAVQLFDQRLAAYGYLAQHRDRYDEPRYTVRDLAAWRVGGAFPRIVEAGLLPGVGDVKYRIVTAGLDAFQVGIQDVADFVAASQP
jgi:hypothetical protein